MSEGVETFPNPNPERDYEILHVAPEFTSVCPKTGQPDFGTIRVRYVPDKLCLELKSFKLYLQSYRNQGIFYEAVTNKILDDLVAFCRPRSMEVVSEWTPRGGLHSVVRCNHGGGRAFPLEAAHGRSPDSLRSDAANDLKVKGREPEMPPPGPKR